MPNKSTHFKLNQFQWQMSTCMVDLCIVFFYCGLSDQHGQYWTLHESLCILSHTVTYCCVWKIMTAGFSTPLCFCLDGTLKPQFWFRGLSLSSSLVVETRAEAEIPLSELQKTGTSLLFCHYFFLFFKAHLHFDKEYVHPQHLDCQHPGVTQHTLVYSSFWTN